MIYNQIDKILKEKENSKLILVFDYQQKKYAKAIKLKNEEEFEYIYFEIKDDNKILKVEDEEILENLRAEREIQENKVY